jgi:hypothetical protein
MLVVEAQRNLLGHEAWLEKIEVDQRPVGRVTVADREARRRADQVPLRQHDLPVGLAAGAAEARVGLGAPAVLGLHQHDEAGVGSHRIHRHFAEYSEPCKQAIIMAKFGKR